MGSVNSESKNFATVAEKLGSKAAVSLKILKEDGALAIDGLHERLKEHAPDFGSRLKSTIRSISSWAALGIVEVKLDPNHVSKVSLTSFGQDVLSLIQEKWAERLLTQNELKKIKSEALALSKGATTFS